MNMVRISINQKGFTLAEFLVINVLVILLFAGFIALLHPKDFNVPKRNAQRRLDVARIVQAISRYKDENNALPSSIPANKQIIGSLKGQSNVCAELVPRYLKDIPLDPLSGAKNNITPCSATRAIYSSAYNIVKSIDGRHVTVTAPQTENSQAISITL